MRTFEHGPGKIRITEGTVLPDAFFKAAAAEISAVSFAVRNSGLFPIAVFKIAVGKIAAVKFRIAKLARSKSQRLNLQRRKSTFSKSQPDMSRPSAVSSSKFCLPMYPPSLRAFSKSVFSMFCSVSLVTLDDKIFALSNEFSVF